MHLPAARVKMEADVPPCTVGVQAHVADERPNLARCVVHAWATTLRTAAALASWCI